MRNEYPRPQFVRKQWQNLNGEWQIAFDDEDKGIQEKWYKQGKQFEQNITVPFVYQSKLSNIQDKTPHDIVWYKKEVELQEESLQEKIVLHFGAVDYEAQVYVNGQKATEHFGGNTPFSVDITPYLQTGVQVIVVRVYDPHTNEFISRGKQIWDNEPRGIWYTNSTGIWQTVWIEGIARKHIKKVKYTSLYDEGKMNIHCEGQDVLEDDLLEYKITYQEKMIAQGNIQWNSKCLDFSIDIIQSKIFRTNFHGEGVEWSPESPSLFQVEFVLRNDIGEVCDEVESYFGFRKIHTENGMLYLNNKPYYQKLVLDQGYWPDSLISAPNDEAIIRDIRLAKEMGFNGCRKHQKVEDPRFLYWADRLGYLVWGENASTVMYREESVKDVIHEWAEIIDRDYNHPSIIAWVPMNESWGVPGIHRNEMQQNFSLTLYHYLHAIDNTRPVISNDGWEMTKTDICAIHNYKHGQKEEIEVYQEFKEALATKENLLSHASTCWDIYAMGHSHQGEPIMLTEFGGIGYDVSGEPGWGYTSVKNEEEFLEDYKRVIDAVYASKGLWGFCYTQLTDIEQEINGLLTYHREAKCDMKKIKQINNRYHVSRIF